VFDKNKVIKLEICTIKGIVLLSLDKNFSFPNSIVKEEKQFGRFEADQSIIIKGKELPVLARGAEISVIAHTRAGDRFNYRGKINMSTEFQLNLSIRQDTSELLEERRRFYKLNTEIPCVLTSVARGDRYVALDPPVDSLIADINIGGVFLKSNPQVEFKTEDHITIVLADSTGETELTSKVLRVQTSPEGVIGGYGCCFLFLNARQEEVIARLIHRIQVDRRNQERDETDDS
jgi:hypothetical protein